MAQKPPDNLFSISPQEYGEGYAEHLLEQYKLFVASVETVSERRLKANEFFLGLNSALLAALGFASTKLSPGDLTGVVLLASVAGITMCYLWYRILRSYKGLNAGKFRLIHAIEARLPLALYDAEWTILGRGKDKGVYWPFTHLEMIVPWVFLAIYLLLTVSLILRWPVA